MRSRIYKERGERNFMGIFTNIISGISEAIEEGQEQARRRALLKDDYMKRLGAELDVLDPLIKEGVNNRYITRKQLAYAICPELKSSEARRTAAAISAATSTNPDARYSSYGFHNYWDVDDMLEGLGYKCTSDGINVRVYKNGSKTAVATRQGGTWSVQF
jgi:hypothetical protein